MNGGDVRGRECEKEPQQDKCAPDGGDSVSLCSNILGLLGDPRPRLSHTPDRTPHINVWTGKRWDVFKIPSVQLEGLIRHAAYQRLGQVISKEAVWTVMTILAGKAMYESPKVATYTRLAGIGGHIFLDLADEEGNVADISAGGTRVLPNPEIQFRRPTSMQPLPMPSDSGDISRLHPFLNVECHAQFVLIVAWLIAALQDRGPFPVLWLHGEQGSAKSTTTRILKELIDPSTAQLRSDPHSVENLVIAAQNCWIQAYDNLSSISAGMSDALCRLATGGTFSTRRLYTNDEETILHARRPVILNGIDQIADRPDLLDRSIVVHLPAITDTTRRTEEEFWRDFEESRATILRSLLDAVSCALDRLPSISPPALPRMADFAQWVIAAEPALGWPTGTFLKAYRQNQEEASVLALDATPVGAPLLAFVEQMSDWTGTATELLEHLYAKASSSSKRLSRWPQGASALSRQLSRIHPVLRRAGIEIEFVRAAHQRRIHIWKASRADGECR